MPRRRNRSGSRSKNRRQQQQQEAPATPKDVILRFTQNVGNKLVTAAEEFPEELFDYRPNEDVRTFGEILLHIARSNDLIASSLAQRAPSDLKQFGYTNKAEAVATLKKSFEDVVAAIEQHGDPNEMQVSWIYALNHGSEHYGNLVVYYRLNGLVPPASR
ncbi:MAG: DinB family protein [Acidobacteria bacterium]|nr:DinB family protein [Acidobacteriota bacterium]